MKNIGAYLVIGLAVILSGCFPVSRVVSTATQGPATAANPSPELVATFTPLPVPSLVPTSTPTSLPTPTQTLTLTATVTFTNSATATATRTSTRLPTLTYTFTATRVKPSPIPATLTPQKAQVDISGHTFKPAKLTVKAGSTVTWTNKDIDSHTVTGNDGSWGSGSLAKGASYSHTFTKPGSFGYVCAFHADMSGVVDVVP